ncbi:hypothetical protein PG993_001708 [Apiospora rasikravindrae]|uniref:Uncharacterized protein n=1 Tax=Apiospora rasikravindrae TaxID=990691 RepID=A0ABR1UEB4_9PEZI
MPGQEDEESFRSMASGSTPPGDIVRFNFTPASRNYMATSYPHLTNDALDKDEIISLQTHVDDLRRWSNVYLEGSLIHVANGHHARCLLPAAVEPSPLLTVPAERPIARLRARGPSSHDCCDFSCSEAAAELRSKKHECKSLTMEKVSNTARTFFGMDKDDEPGPTG